jgi:hypothetical protein
MFLRERLAGFEQYLFPSHARICFLPEAPQSIIVRARF